MIRNVNKVEQSVMHWSVNTMVMFEANHLQVNELREALSLTIKKYPYLGLRIEKNQENGELMFVKNLENEVANYSIVWNDIESEEEFNNWTIKLNLFGSTKFVRKLFNIQLDAFCGRLYRLYFSINHAGQFTFLISL